MGDKKKGINVLFLEDDASTYYYLVEDLEEEGFDVDVATNIARARTLWETKRIDFIIADLNMPPRGLENAEITQTGDGKLTGWIYLDKYVYSVKPVMKERTIILSAYINELKKRTNDGKELEGIKLITKRRDEADEDEMNDVKEALKEMANKLGRREDGKK